MPRGTRRACAGAAAGRKREELACTHLVLDQLLDGVGASDRQALLTATARGRARAHEAREGLARAGHAPRAKHAAEGVKEVTAPGQLAPAQAAWVQRRAKAGVRRADDFARHLRTSRSGGRGSTAARTGAKSELAHSLQWNHICLARASSSHAHGVWRQAHHAIWRPRRCDDLKLLCVLEALEPVALLRPVNLGAVVAIQLEVARDAREARLAQAVCIPRQGEAGRWRGHTDATQRGRGRARVSTQQTV